MSAFFTITASDERRPPVSVLHLKYFPIKGEPHPIENTSYKGYSPPKCTCNVHSPFHNNIPTRTCQFYMECYMSCHEMRCDSSCTTRPSPHRLPHTMLKPMCEKPSFWMTSNDHFQNKFHLFINQELFGWCLTMIILYSKPMHLFVGSEFLVSHHKLRKPKNFYSLSLLGTMSDHNWWVFHLRGGGGGDLS